MTSTTKNKLVLLKNITLKLTLPLILIFTVWGILHRVADQEYIVPSISNTFESLIEILTDKGFFEIILLSIVRVLIGLIIGTLFGVLLAVICHNFFVLDAMFSPIISIMKATPVASIIVLLWTMMSPNTVTISIVLLMVMPIVWESSVNAFNSVDKDLIEVAEIFNLTRPERFRLLTFPTLLKYLIPAIITSVGLAWKAEIAAEILTGINIGELIHRNKNIAYDTATVIAWTIVIIVLSLILEKATKYFLRRLTNESIG